MAVQNFTYAGDPALNAVSAIRFYTGDTRRETAELDDKEIEYENTRQPHVMLCAANLLDVLAARYAQRATVQAGPISRQLGQVADNLRKRAVELRTRAGTEEAVPFFGGLTVAGKDALNQDDSAVQPHARIGQFDNPRTTQMDSNSTDQDPTRHI